MARIAISYRRADSSAICRAIYDRLVQRFGSDSVFMDIDQIPIGENFREYIRSTLKSADVLLVLVGPSWCGPRDGLPARIHDADDPVRMELDTAAAVGTAVLPVLVHHARMPVEKDLPEDLEWFPVLNAAEVDEGRDFDAHIAVLIEAVERHVFEMRKEVRRHGEPPNNLPKQLSKFIGRKSELTQLANRIRNERIVTIVGPGGVGKTRLALQLASMVLTQFPGGAWYVPIGESPTIDVALSVASAMSLDLAERDSLQMILSHVSRRSTLLILDEAEHQIPVITAFAKEAVQLSSFIKILVTSRERLHLAGEQVFPLLPLAVPQPNMPLEDLRRCDSLRLLIDRANSGGATLQISERNAADLVAICERLDGIPLALEFVAARLPALSPHQILQRLNRQLELLVGDKNDESRHRTLRATIEWSYELLDNKECLLFARLGIFDDPFSLDAVEAICADRRVPASSILDTLSGLMEKSFVTKEPDGDSPRFRLLHVIRAFALERLDSSSGRALVEKARFNYFAALIKRFSVADAASRAQYIDQFTRSRADLVGALMWGVSHKRAECVNCALAVLTLWWRRGPLSEGAQLLEAVAESEIPNDVSRVKLLVNAAGLRSVNGDVEIAIRNAEAAVALCEKPTANSELGDALHALGIVKHNLGEFREARDLFLRALPLLQQTQNAFTMSQCLTNLSLCDTALRDYDAAREHALQGLEVFKRNGDMVGEAESYGVLGAAAHQAGKLAEARSEYKRCLQVLQPAGYYDFVSFYLSQLVEVELLDGDITVAEHVLDETLELVRQHNVPRQLPDVFEAAARLLAYKRRDEEAAKLFGSADFARERWRAPMIEAEKKAHNAVVQSIVERHSNEWFDKYYRAGWSLDLPSMLQLATRAVGHERKRAARKAGLA